MSARLNATITEADYQDVIADYARYRGWLVYHARPARTNNGWRTAVQYDGQGFPDLVISRGRCNRWIEVKAARGRLSDPQKRWLDALGCRPDYKPDPVHAACVAYPADWPQIKELLR